jgi:hypothetical protein
MIDQGKLKPAFRFGGSKNIHIPRPIVEKFKKNCKITPTDFAAGE